MIKFVKYVDISRITFSISLYFSYLCRVNSTNYLETETKDEEKEMKKFILTAMVCILALPIATAQQRQNPMREKSPAFFKTTEARRIGDQILLYQRVTGGWPKNIDMSRPLTEEERAQVMADKDRKDDSTTDNNATTLQMNFLARLFQATGDSRYSDAFRRAVDYLLSGQYENGGWPQFWPKMRDYQIHITYNDNAMVNTMRLLREIAQQQDPFGGQLTDEQTRERSMQAFNKGVECILKTQIVYNGELTVWCQQHDRETFLPAKARAYELPSFCSQESAGITSLLMSLPDPDERVKKAVHAAMAWFDKYKIMGLRIKRTGKKGEPNANVELVSDPAAKPLWGRFYDLKNCEPYVCDRDGIPRKHLEEIGVERRTGYSWYNSEPAKLYPIYERWASRYDPDHKISISLNTPSTSGASPSR